MANDASARCRQDDTCPCQLAACRDCPVCSLLRGESVCDCDWPGFCAYDRWYWEEGLPPEGGAG